MSKVRAYELSEKERQALIAQLDAFFVSCRRADELHQVLGTLLSLDERVMLARRVLIARRLLGGRTHAEIAAELKVGWDNIDRVRLWLERNRALYFLLEERTRRQTAWQRRREIERQAPAFSWTAFRRSHPMQFWPRELVIEVGELLESHRRRHLMVQKKHSRQR